MRLQPSKQILHSRGGVGLACTDPGNPEVDAGKQTQGSLVPAAGHWPEALPRACLRPGGL
eukprot:1977418-Rhodomonas_salina.1